ncbi:GNAT family N-acetyltransferase [Streptomyces sp. AM 2-1-1]|uniref:GNAT family N-acetyltransferase n=1 Tax=Streptomyces sp. AM 2-1-1 TaxID=3028709 RepID=UPI0023BA0BC8|nr:GNAT family N-acetyltransferase [Streptomyces sp. AM 2-1-1]WEH41556.1 GNAT family N-acetyltransferase [Streptomyces sp. AM 2-1-1]
MEPTTLTSRRLRLRPFAAGDTDAVHLACQDPEILRWTEIPSPYTRADAELFTATLAPAGWREDSGYHFALVERSGALAGALGLVRGPASGTYEVGFWLAREHRGQGYGTEAVVRAAGWAFSVLGAVRLEWWAEVGNEASLAVALRAGFRRTGGRPARARADAPPRELWSASLFPADLGLPPSGPGRIPGGPGPRVAGARPAKAPGARAPGRPGSAAGPPERR